MWSLLHMWGHQICNANNVGKMFIWQSFMERLLLWVSVLSNWGAVLPVQIYSQWGYRTRKREWHKDRLREKRVLKSESEAKWNRWKKRDGEEKRRREVMGSGAVPGFYWRLGLALARRDKREIIIRPAEAWQPLLGTAMRQTERCVKDWPCHRWRLLLTDNGIWSFTWR